jgi:hypothetical protein
LGGALGHGIRVGIVEGMQRRKASETAHSCMRGKGYSEPAMTDQQREAYARLDKSLQPKARAVMAAGGDISALQGN